MMPFMIGVPTCRDAAAVSRALNVEDAKMLARISLEVQQPAVRYTMGSGQADEVALLAGLKPVLRQLLSPADAARARARFEGLGLAVEEISTAGTKSARIGSTESSHLRTVFVSRDLSRVREAAALELRCDHELALGTLLGYPRCCVEAFVEVAAPRRNPAVIVAAWLRTRTQGGRLFPRLNVLDLAVFHYVSWFPCSFACSASHGHADAVARRIAVGGDGRAFVASIDAALAAHRLLVLEDVQVSLTGSVEGAVVRVERAWATARDRHPAARLGAAAIDAVSRILVRLAPGTTVAVERRRGLGVLLVDGREVLASPDAALVTFGA
jgi:hypothetical protein